MGKQIPVSVKARESLKLYKVLTGRDSYSDAIVGLMREAGYEPPEEELTQEEMLARVFGKDE